MPITTTGRATDFITFTRTSNATVTDSNGFIKWAGHNLLTNSESFDASAWNKASASVSVTANAAAAPDGASTADKIIPSTGNVEHVIINNSAVTTVSGVQYTGAIYAKAAEYGFVFVSLDVTGSATSCAVCVNLSDGTTSNTGGSGTYSVTSVGNGWWRISISATASTTSGYLAAYPRAAAGTTTAYVGTGTSGILLWGAHLYRSDLGGMVLNPARGDAYYPTTPRNLLGFTEDFSNAAWAAVTNATVVSNIANGPNGLATADLIYPSSSGSNRQRYQTVAGQVSGTRYTVSVYLKAASMQWIAMLSPNGANYGAYFDLVNGVKGTEASGVTATITSVGDGWYRCSVSQVSSGTTIYCGISFADANGGTTVTASGTSGIYAWGAQLSDSASLDAYSPVYGAAVTSAAYYAPRLDYDPVTLAARGLLVEEQRTNLLLQSNDLANASWTLANAGSRTASTDVAPDGTTSAATITDNISGNFTSVRQTLTVTNNSAAYAASVYIKKTTSASSYPGVSLALTGGTAKYASAALNTTTGVATARTGETPDFLVVSDAGSYWRLSFGITNNTTGNTSLQLDIYAAVNADASATWVAATTGSVVAWGAQLEANASFATSYIPTGAATATRTADVASVSTQAFPYSASEGTVVANASVRTIANPNTAMIYSLFTDGNNFINSFIWSGAPSTPRGTVTSPSGPDQANLTAGTVSANTAFKSSFAFKANDFAFSLNGSAAATDTTGTMPNAATNLEIGRQGSLNFVNGWIRQITYIPRRLSNAELQSRSV